jgi:23S rRNA pseudouridine2604 synthase
MTEPIRLAKRLADQLGCSRREAEQYIEGGWVSVDGQVVEEPQHRVADQHIELQSGARCEPVPLVTLLLHKPAGAESRIETMQALLSPAMRAADERIPVRVLKKHFLNLTLATPLDTGATGLVVLSQDWRVLRKLHEDAAVMEHEVLVDVEGEGGAPGLARLKHVLGNLPAKVSWQSEQRLRFAFKGAEVGQIAWLCERAGLKVQAMKRLRLGRVGLTGLQPGQWRYLLGYERF